MKRVMVAAMILFAADAYRKLSEIMTGYWVNFAANGDPNGTGLPEWPQFLPQYGNAMMLGDKVEPVQTLSADRIALYDRAFARMMNPAVN